jgi:hypothetical protein
MEHTSHLIALHEALVEKIRLRFSHNDIRLYDESIQKLTPMQ